MDIETLLKRFPRERPVLPDAYKKIYDEHYLRNREGDYVATSLSQKLEAWMHRRVAGDVQDLTPKATLDVGAGTLNQCAYEPRVGRYDIVEPYPKLYERSRFLPRVTNIYRDIADIPPENRYDRITSVATFEHILDLPAVIARAALLLAPHGSVRTGIPNEGHFAWRLGTMVTGFEYFVRFHLNYQVLMRHEHVNTADEIECLLHHFFKENTCAVFGLNKRIAFYRFYESKMPDRERAEVYLRDRSRS